MNLTLKRLGAAAAAGVLSVALVGCGSDESSSDGGSDTSSSEESSEESPDSGESSEGGSSEEGGADASGDQVVAAGIAFDKPQGKWVTISAEELQAQAGGNPGLEEMAKRMNLTVEQLQQSMGQAEIAIFDQASGGNGFTDNINVVAPGGAMPSADQIEQQYTQIGAEVGEVTTEESELGETIVVGYQLPVSADITVTGRTVAVERDGNVVTITVSTTDDARAQQLADDIVASLGEG